MANHQSNFTSNFGEMGETGNAAFVLNVNGVSHTYHPIGSDVNVDVATVRRILATAPNLAQSIATVLAAGGYPILAYDGFEYGYIRTANNRYVFTCLDSLNGVKQAEVDTRDGTIIAGTGGVDGVSILARTDSDLFRKITTTITLGRMPIISDTGVYYQLIAKTGTIAQFGRITGTGALEVLTVNNSDQITSSSFVFVQDPYYVHTDNNFTNTDKSNVDANTNARHTHTNKSVLDDIEQSDIDNWDNKLNPTGDASDTTSTFTKVSGDTSTMTSGSKLSAIFGAISSFFASLKALAFKDEASYNDLSSGVQSSLDKADSALQSHQSVTDNNPTLDWGATSTVGTVGSTNLRVTMPSNPASGKLDTTGNTSDTTSTFTKASGDASTTVSGSKLSAIFTAISSFFASLKALAFKDKVGTGDISDDAITADKVKDNETLPVNVSGTAAHLSAYGEWSTWNATYVESTPFALIGEQTWPLTDNNGDGSVLQFERNNDLLVRLKLCIVTSGSTVARVEAFLLGGTTNLTYVRDNIKITYFTYTSGGTRYIAVRIYVKFTGNLQNWRVRQLDCQTADNGYLNWRPFKFFSGRGTNTDSPVGTPVAYSFRTPFVTSNVGSPSTPVYVDSNGQVQPCLLSLPSTIEYIDLNVGSDDLVIEDGHVYVFGFTNSSGGSVVRRLFCTSTTANVRAQIVIRKDAPGTSCCMVDLLYDSAYVNSQSIASYNVTSSDAGIVLNLLGRRMTINGVTHDYFEVTKQEGRLQ